MSLRNLLRDASRKLSLPGKLPKVSNNKGEEGTYDDEARKLFAKLNLPPSVKNKGNSYNDLDAVWQDPRTGARVYIGNQVCASSLDLLKKNDIKAVVNCTIDEPLYFESTQSSGDNKEESKEKIDYFRFPISTWVLHIPQDRSVSKSTDEKVLLFFKEVFDWIDARLTESKNVLIHCLAGAHRAGTTGVVFVMRTANLQLGEALKLVKKIRPVVQPIYNLGTLAQMYCDAMNSELERKKLKSTSKTIVKNVVEKRQSTSKSGAGDKKENMDASSDIKQHTKNTSSESDNGKTKVSVLSDKSDDIVNKKEETKQETRKSLRKSIKGNERKSVRNKVTINSWQCPSES